MAITNFPPMIGISEVVYLSLSNFLKILRRTKLARKISKKKQNEDRSRSTF